MNENIKTSVHKYYNTKVPILSHWSTTRNKAATLSPEEYEFLYEIVTTNPVYSKKAKLLQDTLHHYQDRKSVNSPLPLIFKQAVYLLAYDLCRGDYYDVAQKKALEDVGLAHNSFSKWWMHPKEDYLLAQHYKNEMPLSMPIYYQGKKNYALVHLADELSKQIHYKTFVDVFCGSGTVTLGIQKYQKRNYYMNDIAVSQTNLINVLRDNSEEFLQALSELVEKIREFSDETSPDLTASFMTLFPEISNWKIIAFKIINQTLSIRKHNERIEKDEDEDKKKKPVPRNIKDIYRTLPDISITDISVANIEQYISIERIKKYMEDSSTNIQLAFSEGLNVFFKKIFNVISDSPIAYAIATVYNSTFSSRRKPQEDYLETFFSTLSYWKKVIKEFQSFKISTLNKYDYLAVEDFNSEDTLLYMDSPYAATAGYKNASYKIENFQKLCDTLKKFRGKWIFSCRAGINYKSCEEDTDDSIDTEDTVYTIADKVPYIRKVLDMYKELAPNVAFIRPSSVTYEVYFAQMAVPKEVMFFNFQATEPDFSAFYKFMHKDGEKRSIGAAKKSVYQIISYEEFYPLAQEGLDRMDGTRA